MHQPQVVRRFAPEHDRVAPSALRASRVFIHGT